MAGKKCLLKGNNGCQKRLSKGKNGCQTVVRSFDAVTTIDNHHDNRK